MPIQLVLEKSRHVLVVGEVQYAFVRAAKFSDQKPHHKSQELFCSLVQARTSISLCTLLAQKDLWPAGTKEKAIQDTGSYKTFVKATTRFSICHARICKPRDPNHEVPQCGYTIKCLVGSMLFFPS